MKHNIKWRGSYPSLQSSEYQQLLSRFHLQRPITPACYNDFESNKISAVLIPLIATQNGIEVLLTRRSENLPHHPGQISFPGGRAEASDPDLISTALRETEEEIGISPQEVQILGQLPGRTTRTRFHITPIVGFISDGFHISANPAEVAEVFSLPLRHLQYLLNQPVYRLGPYPCFVWQHHMIWGATAGLLEELIILMSDHA